jgi:hypothetical protein
MVEGTTVEVRIGTRVLTEVKTCAGSRAPQEWNTVRSCCHPWWGVTALLKLQSFLLLPLPFTCCDPLSAAWDTCLRSIAAAITVSSIKFPLLFQSWLTWSTLLLQIRDPDARGGGGTDKNPQSSSSCHYLPTPSLGGLCRAIPSLSQCILISLGGDGHYYHLPSVDEETEAKRGWTLSPQPGGGRQGSNMAASSTSSSDK